MVAFAGQKYAARSLPILVADTSHTIISFTLVNSISHLLVFSSPPLSPGIALNFGLN